MPGKHRPGEKQVSVWMDESERARLDRLTTEQKEKSRSALILKALQRWDDEDRVPRLEAEVARLTREVADLRAEVSELRRHVQTDEKRMGGDNDA